MYIAGADVFVFTEGNNRAPRGGEKATMPWTEAPALHAQRGGESRREQLLPTTTAVLKG